MSAGSIARVATVLAAGFGVGFAGAHVAGRTAPPSEAPSAPATASVATSFASAMPPSEVRVLDVRELAGTELADRAGRSFTLADTVGAVTVVALEAAPCGSACSARIERLLELRRHLSDRAAERDGAADTAVEFVLVPGLPGALPEAATAAEIDPGASGAGGTRWRVGRAGAQEIPELRERLGLASSPGEVRAARPAVHLFDASGALVQRYRADPLDVARLVEEIAYLCESGD